MILVDTSVWIDYFRRRENLAVSYLGAVLTAGEPFGICGIIFQELLQGAKDDEEWTLLDTYFSTQRFLAPADPNALHRAAAHLFYHCRKQGITPRNSIDCLIAQTAIEHQATLLHNDRDYLHLARVNPELRLLP